MKFTVTLNFGDDAVLRPRTFDSYSDLAHYLEKIPNTFGFFANEKVTIEIQRLEEPKFPLADPRTYLYN